MMNRVDPLISFFDVENKEQGSKGEDTTWNLLVQILLPLVLILTFVVTTEVIGYKEAYKYLWGSTNFSEFANVARQDAIIDAQLQKLFLALEIVRNEENTRLNLVMFPEANHIQRSGIGINDNEFKKLCVETKEIFRNKDSQQQYLKTIYTKVLSNAGFTKARIDEEKNRPVQRRNIERDEITEADKFRRKMAAKRDIMYYRNRKIIHNHIIEFCDGLKSKAVELQDGLLKLLCDEIIYEITASDKDPLVKGVLDSESLSLVKKITDLTIEKKEREIFANEFYRGITGKWQRQLQEDGYLFLETWEKLKGL